MRYYNKSRIFFFLFHCLVYVAEKAACCKIAIWWWNRSSFRTETLPSRSPRTRKATDVVIAVHESNTIRGKGCSKQIMLDAQCHWISGTDWVFSREAIQQSWFERICRARFMSFCDATRALVLDSSSYCPFCEPTLMSRYLKHFRDRVRRQSVLLQLLSAVEANVVIC